MTDTKKVMKGLECCSQCKCEVCPYEELCFNEENICLISPLIKDVLAMLNMIPEEIAEKLEIKPKENQNDN